MTTRTDTSDNAKLRGSLKSEYLFGVCGDQTTSHTYLYDAWNRLVQVKLTSGGIVAEYEWDGLGWRIVKKTYTGETLDETRHFYYTEAHQIVEERVDGTASSDARIQYVWDIRYIDALVLRDRDMDDDGDLSDERLYALQDAQFNVTALVNDSSAVVERYSYTPYGERAVLNANWTAHADPTSGGYAFSISFQGLMRDAESGLIYNRARIRHAQLGRWMQREPLGYVDGMNLYENVASNPLSYYVDPMGLQIWIQTHPVVGPYNHCSLKITPDNQERWAGHPKFKRGADGKWYTTLGASSVDGRLTSNTNRKSDDETAQNENAERCPLSPPLDENGEPIDEDEWVDQLLNADNNYRDNADYDVFPELANGFNSNSYIAGILRATGTKMMAGKPCQKWNRKYERWPGWRTPLPEPYFEPKPHH